MSVPPATTLTELRSIAEGNPSGSQFPDAPSSHSHAEEMLPCVIGNNLDDDGNDLVPKSKALVCGHAVCAFDLDNIRKPWCPACRTPLAGPLVTPLTLEKARGRMASDQAEEPTKAELIKELNRTLQRRGQPQLDLASPELYDKSAEDILQMIGQAQQERYPDPSPAEQELKVIMGSPSILAQLLMGGSPQRLSPMGQGYMPGISPEFKYEYTPSPTGRGHIPGISPEFRYSPPGGGLGQGHVPGISPEFRYSPPRSLFEQQYGSLAYGAPSFGAGPPSGGGEFPLPEGEQLLGAPEPLSPSTLSAIAAIERATTGKPPEPSRLTLETLEAIARSQAESKGLPEGPQLSPSTLTALQQIEESYQKPIPPVPEELPVPEEAKLPPVPSTPPRRFTPLPPRISGAPSAQPSTRRFIPLPPRPERKIPEAEVQSSEAVPIPALPSFELAQG